MSVWTYMGVVYAWKGAVRAAVLMREEEEEEEEEEEDNLASEPAELASTAAFRH